MNFDSIQTRYMFLSYVIDVLAEAVVANVAVSQFKFV